MRRALALLACLALGATVVTPWWCRRGADAAFTNDLAHDRALARGVHAWTSQTLEADSFSTGSDLFDGEWLFGSHLMAVFGYAQTAKRHPELRAQHLAWAEASVDAILSERVRAFDREKHGEDPLAALGMGGSQGHAAYLGYLGAALGALRTVEPDHRFAGLHDRIAQKLRADWEASENGLVATYPNEWYPVDNLAVLAAIQTTSAHEDFMVKAVPEFMRRYVADNGLLVQAVTSDGHVLDDVRGSGTTLGAFFATYVDPALARRLAEGARTELARNAFGFGWLREYPAGRDGKGDIDSGPILFGAGLSASGFAFASARIVQDPAWFASLWALAHLWGGPVQIDDKHQWAVGGPLGNAILFAMSTAEVSS